MKEKETFYRTLFNVPSPVPDAFLSAISFIPRNSLRGPLDDHHFIAVVNTDKS